MRTAADGSVREVNAELWATMDVNDLLSWFEGSAFTISRPKNAYLTDENWDPAGIPVFMTGRAVLRHPVAGMDEHINNRVTFWRLRHVFERHEIRDCPACPRCFAAFVLGA
jgi:hypothetical protein